MKYPLGRVLVVLLAVVPMVQAQGLEMRPLLEPLIPRQATVEQQRLLGELQGLPPSRALTRVYEAYEAAARGSGHDFRVELRSFETLGYGDFTEYRWVDVMTPATGSFLDHSRRFLEMPWIDDTVVYHDLRVEKRSQEREDREFETVSRMSRFNILEALEEIAVAGRLPSMPYALTTYRVRVQLGTWQRSYRAVAFWYPSSEEAFTFVVQDHVIPLLQTVVEEAGRPVGLEEFESLSTGPSDSTPDVRSLSE